MKLVVTDMDGTLLNSQKQLSPRTIPVIRALQRQGVRFAVASGRQYYNLLSNFPGCEGELLYLAENGGIIFDGTQKRYISAVNPELLTGVIREIREMKDTKAVFCGVEYAYVECGQPVFLQKVRTAFSRVKQLDNILEALELDQICKVSVWHDGNAEQYSYPRLLQFRDHFTVNLAGLHWVDLMASGTNKGSAVQMLQRSMEICPEECMAFGDYLNDLDMMKACTHSYAMANAHPDLKAVCRYEAKSNDEDGVIEVLIQQFGLDANQIEAEIIQ